MKRADTAAAEAKRMRWSLVPMLLGVGLLTISNAARLGWREGAVTVAATLIGVTLLLRIGLAVDLGRKGRRIPEGLAWRADAVVYGSDLQKFASGPIARIGPTTQVVGSFDVGGDGLAWTPRGRFAKRGAPSIVADWIDIVELTSTTASSPRARWLAQVDICCIGLADGRDVSIFVTTPAPVHDALSEMGRSPVALESPWTG